MKTKKSKKKENWTFFTNHSHVLICLWRNANLTLREVAEMVGITERAVQAIVLDLEEADILTREKEGRRNKYKIKTSHPLRHSLESHRKIIDLLNLVK
jgi:DNA-binding MarR family transcriptional regulator